MIAAASACLVTGCGYRVGDSFELPYGLLALMIIVVPLLLAAFFGLSAFRGLTPLVFRCRMCDEEFRRAPHLPFPEACPRCGSRDWNGA